MTGCAFEVLPFAQTGTPLDVVPVPGAILTCSPESIFTIWTTSISINSIAILNLTFNLFY